MSVIVDNSPQLFTSNLNAGIISSFIPTTFSLYTPLTYFYSSNSNISNQLNLKQNTLNATCNLLGIGSNITALDYNKITLNKPSVFNPDMTNIYSKTQVDNITTLTNFYNKTSIDTSLNLKQNNISVLTPLTKVGATIGINLDAYPTFLNLNSCNFITNATSGLVNYPTYPILNSCNYITNATSGLVNYPNYTVLNSCNFITNATSGLNNYYDKTSSDNRYAFASSLNNYYLKTNIDALLLQKESNLTFQSPLTRTVNTIGINLNSCNFITNSTTGLLNYPSYTVLNSCNYLTNASLGTTYLKVDGTNYMTGKLGIGISSPNNILQVGNGGRLRIANDISDYSLIGSLDTDGATNTRIVISGNTRAINPGFIEYVATATGGHVFYTTNSGTERMRILNNGNVNIGNANNINCRLYVNSAIATAATCFPLRICAGAATDTNNNATIFGLGTEANGWSKSGIAHVRTTSYDQGDIVFLNRNTADNADCSLAYERMRIYSGGGVNINQGLTIGGIFRVPVDTWHKSSDNVDRLYYQNNSTTFFHSGNGQYCFRNQANNIDNFVINNDASVNINNNGTLNFDTNAKNIKINLWGGVYGFGIQGSTLLYTSDGVHRFMTGGNETLKINTNGYITGAQNVCKRAIFSFTPLYTNFPFTYYSYYFDVNNYISSLATYTTVYAYRITIWTDSGDFGDMSANCDAMQYVFFQSNFAGGKMRFHQIFNNTTTNTINCYSHPTQLYFYGGTNGSKRWCVIENIAGY